MVRVYLVEDGLGYGERYLLAYMSHQSIGRGKRRRIVIGSLKDFSEYLRANPGTVSVLLRRLEEKGYVKVERRRGDYRWYIPSVEAYLKNGEWVKVPQGFLWAGGLKERGLLLTLARYHTTFKTGGDRPIRRTMFYMKDLLAPYTSSKSTLRKLLKNLEENGYIEIEKTRPYYMVRLIW